MNTQDAAYATVHDYPGGATSLGPRIGVGGVVLSSKVNPNTKTHHLTLAEAMKIQSLTGDHRILRAMCEELEYLPPIPRVEAAVSDAALLETFTKMMAELGDFSREFHSSVADGRITQREIDRMQREMDELFAAGVELINRARQLVED